MKVVTKYSLCGLVSIGLACAAHAKQDDEKEQKDKGKPEKVEAEVEKTTRKTRCRLLKGAGTTRPRLTSLSQSQMPDQRLLFWAYLLLQWDWRVLD